jgi:hypothetical protein
MQIRTSAEPTSKKQASGDTASGWIHFSLTFWSSKWSTFLRNVSERLREYTASHPRWQHFHSNLRSKQTFGRVGLICLKSCNVYSFCLNYLWAIQSSPITVAARSKVWNVFAPSSTGIVGSNPTRGMDACVCLFGVWVVLCVDSGLATGWYPVQGVLTGWSPAQGVLPTL